MSGILYVIMGITIAILVIMVVTLTKVLRWSNRLRWSGLTELDRARACRLKDLATFKMHLDAKDQQIADIRRDTEDEMRRLFKDLVDSLHSEIDELCEEKSKLTRTVNLQAAQLEELEKQPEEAKFFIDGNPLDSDFSGICINGVPLTHKELDDELESALQAEYPSTWLYGHNDLLTLPSYDHLYDREVSSDGREWHRFEKRKDNTRQSSYRQVSIDLRKARKLKEDRDV